MRGENDYGLPKCGAKNSDDCLFCVKCGESIRNTEKLNSERQEGIDFLPKVSDIKNTFQKTQEVSFANIVDLRMITLPYSAQLRKTFRRSRV